MGVLVWLCYYNRVEIRIHKIKEGAILPTFAHLSDAGADLFTSESVTIPGATSIDGNPIFPRTKIPTGIALEIPVGYVGLIWDKSGLSTKHGLVTLAGVIDAGYRGEIVVPMMNTDCEPYTFAAGEKIAQILIQPVAHPDFIETVILTPADRGDNGFGSTGK